MPFVHHRRKAGCSLRPKQCYMSAPIAAAGRERTIVAHNFVGVPGAKKLRRSSAITGKSGFDLHEVVATTTPLKLSCRKTSSTVGPNSAALVAGHLARGRTHGAGVPVVTDEVRFRFWPKAAVIRIRSGRQLLEDKLPPSCLHNE